MTKHQISSFFSCVIIDFALWLCKLS